VPAFVVTALGLAGCESGSSAPASAASAAPAAPTVGVVTVRTQTVALKAELPGRVEPLRTAQVRARVNGVVLKRQFSEGSAVAAGQPLFQIDPAPYQAALDSASAQLARAQAGLAQATATAERYKPLAEGRAISQQDYVNARMAQKLAEADVAAGTAAVQAARINLGYAQVTAPIAGRVGRALVTEGALVSAAEATPLALIQQIDRVYVNFTQSSAEVLRLRRAMAGRPVPTAADAVHGSLTVEVVLEDGSLLPGRGRLLFTDLSVDAGTGQVTLRAEVPNADGLMLPGQYVRVRIAQTELPAGILIPQQAVRRSPTGDSVLVVGEGRKPAQRRVKLAGVQDGQWVVTDGLVAGEQVIIDGFQKLNPPGAPVNPVPWVSPGTAPVAAPAASAAAAPASVAARAGGPAAPS
jgi:membrane fusion protein (multidrug efflux system)